MKNGMKCMVYTDPLKEFGECGQGDLMYRMFFDPSAATVTDHCDLNHDVFDMLMCERNNRLLKAMSSYSVKARKANGWTSVFEVLKDCAVYRVERVNATNAKFLSATLETMKMRFEFSYTIKAEDVEALVAIPQLSVSSSVVESSVEEVLLPETVQLASVSSAEVDAQVDEKVEEVYRGDEDSDDYDDSDDEGPLVYDYSESIECVYVCGSDSEQHFSDDDDDADCDDDVVFVKEVIADHADDVVFLREVNADCADDVVFCGLKRRRDETDGNVE